MAIDIGAAATDRGAGFVDDYTIINKDNPANASGIITSIEVWAYNNITDFKVGIFYVTNGNTLKCRSAATIGAVTAGSKQTFPLDPGLAVEVGDYLGCYFSEPSAANIERDTEGYGGLWFINSDQCNVDDEAVYSLAAGDAISLYGIGTEGDGVTEKTSSDTGSGADAKKTGNPLATMVRSETGSGVEALPGRGIMLPETGSGVDALFSLLGILSKSESGAGVDASVLSSLLAGSDSGAGQEALALVAAILASEQGQAVETLLSYVRNLVDSGQGIDVGEVLGMAGVMMKLLLYTRSHHQLRVYTAEVKQ